MIVVNCCNYMWILFVVHNGTLEAMSVPVKSSRRYRYTYLGRNVLLESSRRVE